MTGFMQTHKRAALLPLLIVVPVAVATVGCGASADFAESQTAPLDEGAPVTPGAFAGFEYFGDGCADTNTTSAISPDGQAFTTIFSNFVTAVGPGAESDPAALGCLLRAQVKVPAGSSFTLNGVHQRGFAMLEAGVTGQRQSVYILPDQRPQLPAASPFTGPSEGDYLHSDVGPEAPVGWSSCGRGDEVRDVWMAVQLGLQNKGAASASGMLALDTLDAELAWRACR